jgi:hypothetical protein
LSKVIAHVAIAGGTVDVEAVEVVPGLLLHHELGFNNGFTARWVVTHKGSGMKLPPAFKLRRQAREFALSLRLCVDWEWSAERIKAAGIGSVVLEHYRNAANLR